MSEAEWLTCDDPHEMLLFLWTRFTQRKRRLFACSCCRRIWPLFKDERSRAAVEFVERRADGQRTSLRVKDVLAAAQAAVSEANTPGSRYAASAAADLIPPSLMITARCAVWARRAAAAAAKKPDPYQGCGQEAIAQAAILRDLFGPLPYRSIPVAPVWLTSHGGAGRRIARGIYSERTFDRLPILADALEDARCDNAELLGHLRGPGPHVRGCWAVDLLLDNT
jgi:hypothetical protein